MDPKWLAVVVGGAEAAATNGSSSAGFDPSISWPHADLEDIRVLAGSLGVHEGIMLGEGKSNSGIAALMPHGSTYFLRTLVVLMSPFVLAAGLSLFWIVVDAVDGCLYEHVDDENEERENEEGLGMAEHHKSRP